jgi:hydrogenase maturation protease
MTMSPGDPGPTDVEGRTVPPSKGRREAADVDGATGPGESDTRRAPDPEDTPRGSVASPAEEMPADEPPEGVQNVGGQMTMHERRVLVAGIGNVFRTDDGFGCEVARRLAGEEWPPGVRVADYGIRGLHLAYDLLDPWDVLVLVDALPDRGNVGSVAVIGVGPDDVGQGGQVDAHGMDPVTVLASLAALGGSLPDRTLVVGCQVADTGDGMGVTPPVAEAVEEALRTVRELVRRHLQPTEVA